MFGLLSGIDIADGASHTDDFTGLVSEGFGAIKYPHIAAFLVKEAVFCGVVGGFVVAVRLSSGEYAIYIGGVYAAGPRR